MAGSRIPENWRRGLGFPDVMVIDAHVHLGEWISRQTFSSAEEVPERGSEFPDPALIGAHGAPGPLLVRHGNVYANTWTSGAMGSLDRAIAEAGAGKLMLGSDGLGNPMSAGIEPVVRASITDEERQAILELNVAPLLDGAGILPAALRARMTADNPSV